MFLCMPGYALVFCLARRINVPPPASWIFSIRVSCSSSWLRLDIVCFCRTDKHAHRSSSDDSVVNTGGEGASPLPATVTLDKSFVAHVEDFRRAWESLQTCASFRYERASATLLDAMPAVASRGTGSRKINQIIQNRDVLQDNNPWWFSEKNSLWSPKFADTKWSGLHSIKCEPSPPHGTHGQHVKRMVHRTPFDRCISRLSVVCFSFRQC